MSKNSRATSFVSDVFGKPTGRVGGRSKEEYDKKYGGFKGLMRSMGSKMSEHSVERESVKTNATKGRNNPRGAKGAR